MQDRKLDIIIAISAAIMVFFTIISLIDGTLAYIDSLVSLAVVVLASVFRKQLRLNYATAFFGNLFLSLHLVGANWTYGLNFYNIGYDKFMHVLGPFVLVFVIFNMIEKIHTSLPGIIMIAALAALGITAIHEVVELVGGTIFGSGDGFLLYGPGDKATNDTATDLLANFIGTVSGSFFIYLRKNPRNVA